MKGYLSAVIVLSMLLGMPCLTQASERIDEIIVTADRIEQSAQSVTHPVTVISQDEIANGRYDSISHVLQKYGFGVVGFGNDSIKSSVHIRGMSNGNGSKNGSFSGNILILIDGRRAGSEYLGIIPLVAVERIEVLRGVSGVQYGSNGIGGVINIITKRGGDDVKASVEVGAGSWKTAVTEAFASGKSGIADMSAGISWMTHGDNYDTGNGEYKNTKIHNLTNYALNIGITPFEEHRLGVSLVGTSLDHAGDSGGFTGLGWGTSNSNYYEHESHSVDILYEGGFRESGLSWKARYFHSYDKYVSNYVDYGFLSEYPETMNGVQAQVSWNDESFTLTGGFDMANSKTWSDGKTEDYAGLDNKAFFALAKYSLMNDFVVLSAGVRYDDFELKGVQGSSNKDKSTYSLGIAVNPFDYLTVRAQYGTSFKMPTGLQVTGYSDSWTNTYIGNPNLKPEEGKGWDVGFEFEHAGLNAGVVYFQTDYENKIASRSAGMNEQEYYNMSGTSQYRGIEINASWDLGQTFDWDFVLKPYVHATNLFKYRNESGESVPYVRDWEMSYGIEFFLPSTGTQLDFNMMYLGKQHETYPKQISGGDTTANLHITQQMFDWGEKGRLSAKLSVVNLFDVSYAPKIDYPAQGRSFYLSFKYEY